MKGRYLQVSPDADQKQEERFNIWLLGEEIPFVDADAKAAYRERITLMKDAIQFVKTPRRVPICPSAGFFPIQYAGMTMYDAMYNYEALKKAVEKYHLDLEPDVYNAATVVPGKALDLLDYKLYQWPGHGLAKEREYQFVEDEYMKAEEYGDLIDDPTAFFLNCFFPRVFGSLQAFESIPLLPGINEILLVPPFCTPFGTEAMKKALAALTQAGEESLRFRAVAGEIGGRIMGKGFPSFAGGFTKAPFDVIGDSLRGTKGIMLDMFRYPEELKEACERLTPIMVKYGINSCRVFGHIMPFIPLHKGADGFLSDEQFQTFYWPTLRKVIIGLVNEGFVPLLFAEGGYNQRLDTISDVPKGKTVWWFDRTDMSRAKETVGRVSCIAGNFPVDLLCTAAPDEIRKYCKMLIKVAGEDGRYIFSTGAGMQGAKAENVKVMIETIREYGGYDT